MKKDKVIKITLLSLAILACISIPIILYFTLGNSSSAGKVNLSQQNVSYLADVEHLTSISGQEATTIKGGIQTNIDNKMNSLKLEADTDYTTQNLDSITSGSSLKDLTITVNSVPESTKATGSLNVLLNVREDIANWSIDTQNVPADQSEGLDALTADRIRRDIIISVDDILNEGQANSIGDDYQINNLNLIATGAKFADYSTQISVTGLSRSTHLKGTFQIKFQLQ